MNSLAEILLEGNDIHRCLKCRKCFIRKISNEIDFEKRVLDLICDECKEKRDD
jgi:hypothetical protein